MPTWNKEEFFFLRGRNSPVQPLSRHVSPAEVNYVPCGQDLGWEFDGIPRNSAEFQYFFQFWPLLFGILSFSDVFWSEYRSGRNVVWWRHFVFDFSISCKSISSYVEKLRNSEILNCRLLKRLENSNTFRQNFPEHGTPESEFWFRVLRIEIIGEEFLSKDRVSWQGQFDHCFDFFILIASLWWCRSCRVRLLPTGIIFSISLNHTKGSRGHCLMGQIFCWCEVDAGG